MSTYEVATVWALVAGTLAMTLSGPVAAQYQQQPPSGDADARTGKPVTLIGCLVPVDRSNRRAGTTGSTDQGTTPKQSPAFVLKNVATKESATAEPKRSEREVAVTTDTLDLAAYAGQQVEVTGRFRDPAAPRGGAASTGTEGAAASRSPYGLASDFTITDIRTTAASCGSR